MNRGCAICAAPLDPDNQTQTCLEDKLLLRSGFYDNREIWVPAVGYEGLYEVSSRSRVRSISRMIVCKDGRIQTYPGQLLKLTPHRQGYLQVTLGRRGWALVHRLMLMSFIGPPPPGLPEAAHRNDVPDDNRFANLYWTTRSGNQLDQVRNGNHFQANKTHCIKGHEFTVENTRIDKNGGRHCRVCMREFSRAYRRRNRDEINARRRKRAA